MSESTNWLPPNYSRMSRLDQMNALESVLIELGFDIAEVLENIDGVWIRTVFDFFNAARMVQVFGVAPILAENQPLTVRSAIYRGMGTLWQHCSDPNDGTGSGRLRS